jgi:isopentenyl diphosphate isomerase/L-lactate dehydrogenase-like FMN-dependent dehydrogenase
LDNATVDVPPKLDIVTEEFSRRVEGIRAIFVRGHVVSGAECGSQSGENGGPHSAKALDIIANELSVTMGLCGVDRIEEIDANVLAAPTPF